MANTLLLTYFGPFPGVSVNPTVALAEGAVRALNTARPDLRIVARELPVSSTDPAPHCAPPCRRCSPTRSSAWA